MTSFILAALYLTCINILTFIAFAWDKRAAINGDWRVKESTLLLMAAVGGTLGAFVGQQKLRHKTVKQPFRAFLILIAAAQVIALSGLAYLALRGAI